MIRITAKQDGFRRCGVAHPKEATEYADDRFTPGEIKVLQAEPMLVVQLTGDGPAPSAAPQMNAKDKITAIKSAATIAALEELAKDDTRATVIEAANKRRQELGTPAESAAASEPPETGAPAEPGAE